MGGDRRQGSRLKECNLRMGRLPTFSSGKYSNCTIKMASAWVTSWILGFMRTLVDMRSTSL